MYTSKVKKVLSLLLAIIMLFTMMPTTIFSLGADSDLPMMMEFTAASSADFHKYYNKVYSVTFLDEIDAVAMDEALESWDISAAQDGSVMSWMKTSSANSSLYDVYIAGEGGVAANPKSGFIFYLFTSLEEVDARHFKTDNATTFVSMFENCYKLKKVDFSGWNTENVTNMESMFRNCQVLDSLDLSSFNTSKVTTMKFMFYLCKKLKHIYVGDGWTTESIANLYDGVFNCCYAIIGGTDDDKTNQEIYESNPNPPISGFYANCENGGYLTYKAPDAPEEYTVTYSFTGDNIPENVTLPADAVYEKGTTVTVADAPTAEGYIFNGWSTEDATVENDEFVINNDVHIVGSWEKLYKVEYKYDQRDDRFEVPEDAPELPEAVYYKAGDDVDLLGIPYVYRYLFIGWYTDDADITGSIFTMPENDVTIYGYFKIPVESIEILDNDDIILDSGEKTKISVYVKPEDATIKDIVYESSNPEIAEVDKYGNITAKKEGTVTITVKSEDDPTKKDEITVTVKIPVKEFTVDKTEITIREDGSEKINVTVNEDATNKEVVYESEDETIVKVDEDGNITPVGPGTTTITVTPTDNPDKKVVVTVTVKNPVTEITAKDLELTVGDEKNLGAKVNEDATNKELIYEISDPGVAKVDSNGGVIAVGEGTTTVTITSKDDPSITKEVTVKVNAKKYNVTYVYTGDVPENAPALPEGESYKAEETVTVKGNPSLDGYTFSGWSTDDAVIGEDAKFTMPEQDVVIEGSWTKINYYDVTYKYEGDIPANAPEVPVKVTYEEGEEVIVAGKPASVDGYTFTGWDTNDVAVTDGKFNIYNDVELIGRWEKIPEYNVTYKYEGDIPANAPAVPDKETYREGITVGVKVAPALDGYTFSGWSTTDVTVSDGEFTMPAKDVELIGRWEKIPVEDIIVETPVFELTEGDTDKIIVTVTPDSAADKEVTYKSDDETVVKVDEDGKITAVGEGETTITVTSKDDPSIKEVITVTVKKPIVYYTVTYKYKGTVPEGVPAAPKAQTYEAGTEVTVEKYPASIPGYAAFLGWKKAGVQAEENSKFVINSDVEFVGEWYIFVTDITAPEKIEIVLGQETNIGASVTPGAANQKLHYRSDDESVAKVDAEGNIVTNKVGTANIYITSDANPDVYAVVVVTVIDKPEGQGKHYMVFGKTEKIGWYSVSFDGGKTFRTVFGNSNHVVDQGTEVIIRANDVFGDPFTFYINGKAVTPDENGYVRVKVDGYVLVGALGIPVIAPDGYESLNWIQKIIQTIKDFFAKIASWFKK